MTADVKPILNGYEVLVDEKFSFVFRLDANDALIETANGYSGPGNPDSEVLMVKRCKALAALEREGKAVDLKLTAEVARAYARY